MTDATDEGSLAAAPTAAKPPSFEDLVAQAAYSSSGIPRLRGDDWPNGLILKVTKTDVRADFEGKGWDAYLVGTTDDKDSKGAGRNGEVYLRITGAIGKKLALLGMATAASAIGKTLMLVQIETQGKKTFQIGRVL